MTAGYEIRPMRPAEIATAVEWAAGEGWNPGNGDAGCFVTVDPEGFIGGFLDGRMVASITVMNYDDRFAFLGFYIVRPEQRGKGLGYALWQAGMRHAGDRLVGLDGVVAQQDNYRKSGFELAWNNVRYGGTAPAVTAPAGVRPVTRDLRGAILAYDRRCFPAPREAFLDAWLGAAGHEAKAAVEDGRLKGYGVIRPSRDGWKVGPLFADDAATARTLLHGLLAPHAGATVCVDPPDSNPEAVALARALGLAPVFETARMYTGPAPAIETAKVFGITSFELG